MSCASRYLWHANAALSAARCVVVVDSGVIKCSPFSRTLRGDRLCGMQSNAAISAARCVVAVRRWDMQSNAAFSAACCVVAVGSKICNQMQPFQPHVAGNDQLWEFSSED